MKASIRRRWWTVTLVACMTAWSVAIAARTIGGQAPPAAPQPAAQAMPAQTTPPPAQTPDATKKKNRFASLDDEEDAKPAPAASAKSDQAKPDAAKAGEQKKSRFGADDEEEKDPPPPAFGDYTGTARCVSCHQKQAKQYYAQPHGRTWDARTPAADIGCERCHGPGHAHDLDPGKKGLIKMFPRMSPREATKECMSCHYKSQHALMQGSTHDARNVTCVNCHSVHSAKSEHGHLKGETVTETCAQCHQDKAAKMQRTSHMPIREGKMDCSSCHDAHGSTNVKQLRGGSTVNEACLRCHAEKRGPFLWEHAPVAEKCTSCHDAHGSSNSRMLVAKETMLCQRCHVGTRHPATPYDGATLAAGNNRLISRGCLNCHQTIHGSNHPSGQFFER
jgi:DmsE family decaheme c-type cytochrome